MSPDFYAFLYLPGVIPLYFLNVRDKIAQVIKTIAVGNLCNRIICSGKLVTGLLDPLMVQIIHRSLMGHFGKEPAKILR